MDKRPLVAVCLPCQDTVKTEFALSLAALTNASGLFKFALIRGSSSIVTNSRNFCVDNLDTLEESTKWKFDWTFWVDSDIKFPATALHQLISHGKDIVGASYPRRTPPYDVMAKFLEGQPIRANSGVHEVEHLPLGCMLIRRAILHEFPKPRFRLHFDEARQVTIGEDVVFCQKARSLGYKVFVDIDLTKQLGHVGEQIFTVQEHDEPPNIHIPTPDEIARLTQVANGRG